MCIYAMARKFYHADQIDHLKPQLGPLLDLILKDKDFCSRIKLSNEDQILISERPNDRAVVLGVRRLFACALLTVFKVINLHHSDDPDSHQYWTNLIIDNGDEEKDDGEMFKG